jgi:hypothetical protein
MEVTPHSKKQFLRKCYTGHLAGKPEDKASLRRPGRRWKKVIKYNFCK